MQSRLRTAPVALLIASLSAGLALAQKQGGILRAGHFDSPASMSMLEESTLAVNRPVMGVFNNLVMFEQQVAPLAAYPNIRRWFHAIDSRPAVAKARAIGSSHSFKKEVDEETRRALFPSNYPPAAA
jgi:hypothetical protein